MKKKFSLKEVLVPTVALFLIASICTAILAYTNSITLTKIKENEEKTKIETRLLVCPDAKSFGEDKSVNIDGVDYFYNEALSESGDVVGYAITTFDKGYGGTVSVMVGTDKDGKITGVQTLELSETAGLGMNAKKEDFRNQYKDKSGPFIVNKDNANKEEGKDEIQALTGATITSRAVTNAVNKAVKIYKTVTGGDNNG